MPDALSHEATVAANAKRLREVSGYTQEQVAKLMTEAGFNIGEMGLWALENGKRRIKVADMIGLATVFDLPAEMLLSPLSEAGEPDAPQSSVYEVAVSDGTRCSVEADAISAAEYGLLNFYVRGTRVFFTPVTSLLFCRLAKEVGDV